MRDFVKKISHDLRTLGIRPDGMLMVHSSLKSLGWIPGGAEIVIQALISALGPNGTLLMPALTYETVRSDNPCFDINATPSCVGIISETFRRRAGSKRSLHPTHSVCATGPKTELILTPHQEDSTPCGPNSPFHRLLDFDGQILMLGCGLRPNTTMHAIEEIAGTPYLLKSPIVYTLVDKNGDKIQKEYSPHNFTGYTQRYDRVARILNHPDLHTGNVLSAQAHLIDAAALKSVGLAALQNDPLFFVDPIPYTKPRTAEI